MLSGAALELARDSPAVVRPVLERLDEGRGPERRASQRAEHGQHGLVERVETMGLQRVRRERAHDLAPVGQRAPEARVHVIVRDERPLGAGVDLAVERIGQQAVGGKRTGLRDRRMTSSRGCSRRSYRRDSARPDRPKPATGTRCGPSRRSRHAASQGIDAAHARDQPAVPIARRQRGREIQGDVQQDRERLLFRSNMLWFRQRR